jgi:hypothetical protein
MASRLIVEDGTGIPGSNSYIDAVFVSGYLLGSALTAWEVLDEDAQESDIISATRYVDNAYSWKGTRKTLEQGLSWPRDNATFDGFPLDGVPAQVKSACADAVGLILAGEEFYSTDSEREVASETIGPISVTYKSSDTRKPLPPTKFESLNGLLKGTYQNQSGRGQMAQCRVRRV